ncbi:MAG: nuclear transport factor 2 family protein [Pseudomonadota bacterium]
MITASAACFPFAVPAEDIQRRPAVVASSQQGDTEARRTRNLEAVRDYFRLQREKDLDAWIDLWAEDGVFVIAYPPEGFPNRIEGRAALEPLYRQMFEGYGELRYHNLDIRPLLDPDQFVATWTTDLDLKAGGTYVNHLIALFSFRSGKIARYDEYFDPRLFAAAQARSAGRMDLERWARNFVATVDRGDPSAIGAELADDVRLTLGNQPTVVGRTAVESVFAGSRSRFRSVRHDVLAIMMGSWEGGDAVSVEAMAHYVFPDGRVVRLPVTSTFRLRDGKVSDYRIFMDPGPAFGG